MRLAALVVAVALLFTPVALRVAHAQSDPKKEAGKLVQQGDRLFKKGDYGGALGKYQAAYQVFPSPKLYYPMAKAEEKLGRPIDAIGHYEQFLAEVGEEVPEELRADAQAGIVEQEKQIAVIALAITPDGVTITLDDAELGASPWDKPIRVMPGAHRLTFSKDGYKPVEKTLNLEAGQRSDQTVRLVKESTDDEPVVEVPPVEGPPVAGKSKRQKVILYSGIGATGALALGWIVTGSLALGDHGDFRDTDLDGQARADARDSGKTMALVSDAFLIGTLAAGGFTAWYYFKVYNAPPKAAGPREAPASEPGAPPVPGGDDEEDAPPGMGAMWLPVVTPGGAGVAVVGTF